MWEDLIVPDFFSQHQVTKSIAEVECHDKIREEILPAIRMAGEGVKLRSRETLSIQVTFKLHIEERGF